MIINVRQNKKIGRIAQIGVACLVATVALVGLFWSQAQAFRFVGGAYGCGDIDVSIANTEEGKTMIPMVPERASKGAVISKSMVIQGGWNYFGSELECANKGPNPSIFGTQGLRDVGFVFQAPITRSELNNDGYYSILTISDTVSQVAIEHMSFNNVETFSTNSTPQGETGYVERGGAIYGVIDGGDMVRLTNVLFTDTQSSISGGGFYMEVRGGSHLIIEDSEFIGNSSVNGAGLNIRVYDDSMVTIIDSKFEGNTASGSGGAGWLQLFDGTVHIMNSSFSNNSATGGSGGALQLEGNGGDGTVYITNSRFEGNTAVSDPDVSVSGSGITVYNLGETIYLPALFNESPPSGNYAAIQNITLNENYDYVVEFEAYNFTPSLPNAMHVHFFFNTVAPEEAGMPGSGPWEVYGSTEPFTGYNDTDKPPFATHMCVLVANSDHSVQQNTGNCYRLPVNR